MLPSALHTDCVLHMLSAEQLCYVQRERQLIQIGLGTTRVPPGEMYQITGRLQLMLPHRM